MSDDLIIPLYLAACAAAVACFHWRTWRRSVAGFLAGRISRASCLGRVAGWQFLGLLVPTGTLLLLVGIEEVAKSPLVPERITLLALGLTGMQMLAGLATFIAALGRTYRPIPPP